MRIEKLLTNAMLETSVRLRHTFMGGVSMGILSSKFILRKCRLCQQEKQHYVQGFYTAPACVDCMKTLPPVPQGMRRCPNCLRIHSYKNAYCKQCKSEYVKARYNAEEKRDAHLRRTYGITAEEYDFMFFQQGGCCAICNKPEWIIDPYMKRPKMMVVDHNHETGEPRELLCHRCNILLGALESDRGLIRRMQKYLKKHDT